MPWFHPLVSASWLLKPWRCIAGQQLGILLKPWFKLLVSILVVVALMSAAGVLSWWRHQLEKNPRYWPFVWGIHRAPVNSPHTGQWRGALVFSLICAWINDWVNNGEAGDLVLHRAHCDVTVMCYRRWSVLLLLMPWCHIAASRNCGCWCFGVTASGQHYHGCWCLGATADGQYCVCWCFVVIATGKYCDCLKPWCHATEGQHCCWCIGVTAAGQHCGCRCLGAAVLGQDLDCRCLGVTDWLQPLPRKQAITCLNWARTGPMPVASARFWPS